MNVEDKLLLDIASVSGLLSIGRSRTYQLVMSGQLASLKLGRRRLIPREAVEAFVAKQMEAAAEAQ